jgi:hypothetical protein
MENQSILIIFKFLNKIYREAWEAYINMETSSESF